MQELEHESKSSDVNMDSATSIELTESLTTLELFENELPDTFLELFSHLSFEANREFHIFPKLPLEIRLEIWRLMIPRGRTVQIEVRRSPIRAREFFILGSHTPTPVALHVNYESRQESLRHFKVLKYNLRGQPVYFRPELDLIYFHMKNPPLDFPLEFFKCSSYIDGGDTAELESIQNVMFKNFDYSWPTLLGNQYTWWLQNGTYGQKGTHRREAGGLQYFSHLKNLVLVLPNMYKKKDMGVEFEMGIERDFRLFFESVAGHWQECEIPHITLRNQRPRYDDPEDEVRWE